MIVLLCTRYLAQPTLSVKMLESLKYAVSKGMVHWFLEFGCTLINAQDRGAGLADAKFNPFNDFSNLFVIH